MIGSHLDMDMQYDLVSQKIGRYKKEHLAKSKKIKAPIMEECEDLEADSDFEDDYSPRHPDDDKIYAKVLSRISKRLKFFKREKTIISLYPL